jgi:hypothetical protein
MASSSKAPKQWCLTKHESINTYESWKQNLIYVLSLDKHFSPYLEPNKVWKKKSKAAPLRGFVDDGTAVAEADCRTAIQKVATLELLLGQVANYCPIISHIALVRNSTCMGDIWQTIRLHYGFQATGAHFLDLAQFTLESEERPEDLYQRIVAFVEDNLLVSGSPISHHGEPLTEDEELTPTLENFIVLTWLRLIHIDLPKLIKQRYGTELRSRTLASIKPEISLALDSLLNELSTSDEAQVMRAGFNQPRPNRSEFNRRDTARSHAVTRTPQKGCALCLEAKRPSQHYLSECKFLPESDRRYMTRNRNVHATHDYDSDEPPCESAELPDESVRRIQVVQSPFMDFFYKHEPVHVTLDSGATGNMMRYNTARRLGARISETKHSARQADGSSQLRVMGEISVILTRDDLTFKFDGLVVESLDVDVLGGVPFLKTNDIQLRPSHNLVIVNGMYNYVYGRSTSTSAAPSVRRTRAVFSESLIDVLSGRETF